MDSNIVNVVTHLWAKDASSLVKAMARQLLNDLSRLGELDCRSLENVECNPCEDRRKRDMLGSIGTCQRPWPVYLTDQMESPRALLSVEQRPWRSSPESN